MRRSAPREAGRPVQSCAAAQFFRNGRAFNLAFAGSHQAAKLLIGMQGRRVVVTVQFRGNLLEAKIEPATPHFPHGMVPREAQRIRAVAAPEVRNGDVVRGRDGGQYASGRELRPHVFDVLLTFGPKPVDFALYVKAVSNYRSHVFLP